MTIQGHLIAGEWVGGSSAMDNVNPSDTNDIIGAFALGTAADVKTAIAAARAAAPAWARSTTQMRSDILFKISSELLDRREELGELLAREEGKTRAEGIGEVTRAAQVFRFFAGETVRI